MYGLGLTQKNIASVMKLDPKTLRLHYREEMDEGEALINANVARSLYLNATVGNNVTAQIFWCKTRMRWRETGEAEDMDEDEVDGIEVITKSARLRDDPDED